MDAYCPTEARICDLRHRRSFPANLPLSKVVDYRSGNEGNRPPFGSKCGRSPAIALSSSPKIPLKQLLSSAHSRTLDRQMVKGTIQLESMGVSCTISTLSKTGACLLVETTNGIPEVFVLIMPNRRPKSCKVMWRDDARLGVHFRQI
jgi:hypothetical protein